MELRFVALDSALEVGEVEWVGELGDLRTEGTEVEEVEKDCSKGLGSSSKVLRSGGRAIFCDDFAGWSRRSPSAAAAGSLLVGGGEWREEDSELFMAGWMLTSSVLELAGRLWLGGEPPSMTVCWDGGLRKIG